MARDATQYPGIEEDLDLQEELQTLDWDNWSEPPIHEAATLIYDILNEREPRNIIEVHDLLNDVPTLFRNAVSDDLFQQMYEVKHHLKAPTDSEEYVLFQPAEQEATQDSAQESVQHVDNAGLHYDLERTQHILKYVEEVCGLESAKQLAYVMHDSRHLAIRQMQGDMNVYGSDPHETYIQCILDIPAILDAKRAMSLTEWNDDDLQKAVQHEANRMTFRLNLEIQDRLVNQFAYEKVMSVRAILKGTGEDITKRLDEMGKDMAETATMYRLIDNPTSESLEVQANLCIMERGLETLIQQGTDAELRELITPTHGLQELNERVQQIQAYVEPEILSAIKQALETAAQWSDAQITDGSMDYHANFAHLGFKEANLERLRWLTENSQGLPNEAGDCVTRALNEAIGGGQYGPIWESVNERVKVDASNMNTDKGANRDQYGPIYEEYGMQAVLETSYQPDHLMRKHIDIREIPALFGHLFDDENPLTYIAVSEKHAVAVVAGELRDLRDTRDMGERNYKQDGTIVQIWLKCDDEQKLDSARQIIEHYAEVRRYDDVLTYSLNRRTAPIK